MSVLVNTDSFSIASPPSLPGRQSFNKLTFGSTNDWTPDYIISSIAQYPGPTYAIEELNSALKLCGWTSTNLYGQGIINLTLYSGGPYQTVYFNNPIYPGRKTTFTPINPGGLTPFQMLKVLAIALNEEWGDLYLFVAAISSVYPFGEIIQVTAVMPGAIPNQPRVGVPIGVAFGNNGSPAPAACYGGGYRLVSPLANNKTSITVDIVGDILGQVSFTFDLTGPQYKLFFGSLGVGSNVPAGVIPIGGKQPSYTAIIGPYQFVIVDDVNTLDFQGTFGYGGNSLLVCCPFVDPSVMPTLTTSKFIVGPGMLKNQMTWNAGGSSSYNLGFEWQTFQGLFASYNGFCTFIFPTADPIETSNFKPLTINPNVIASQFIYSESEVIGKLWVAMIVTKAGWLPGAEQQINGYICHLISQQNGPEPCSLWMGYD